MKPFISDLTKILGEPLPGWPAQKHLMPEGRELEQIHGKLHPAAVLIALFEKDDEWWFPLIRRTVDGFAHSGQIALPGGRRDGDESDIQTALREAHEEVNIHPQMVQIVGRTSPLPIPVSNHLVQPVVGYLHELPEFKPEPLEVAEIFYVEVGQFRDQQVRFESRHFKERDWEIPFFEIQGHRVWGATAMILSEFKTLLSRVT